MLLSALGAFAPHSQKQKCRHIEIVVQMQNQGNMPDIIFAFALGFSIKICSPETAGIGSCTDSLVALKV